MFAKEIDNIPFIVRASKIEDFLNKKRNEYKWNKILERTEKLENNMISKNNE